MLVYTNRPTVIQNLVQQNMFPTHREGENGRLIRPTAITRKKCLKHLSSQMELHLRSGTTCAETLHIDSQMLNSTT